MGMTTTLWSEPCAYLRRAQPDTPTFFFAPHVLARSVAQFKRGFPGLVSYAIKANPARDVLENLMAQGIDAFDVASPVECKRVRDLMPNASLNYNNPVRSMSEIRAALDLGVRSFSVDRLSELQKVSSIASGVNIEMSVRLHLPVKGAAYDFGAKFGASPERTTILLQEVASQGFAPSMTFHPGTQCTDPTAWETYIEACGEISRAASVPLARLNVGGGFPTSDADITPALDPIFAMIRQTWRAAFQPGTCTLVCEPGRAIIAEAYSLATRVRAVGPRGEVFLNDGIYGGLAELPTITLPRRITCYTQSGALLGGPCSGRLIFGPTCDSLDVLPGKPPLPDAIAEGDYVVFDGMGAYSSALSTRFNGYGAHQTVTVTNLNESTCCS